MKTYPLCRTNNTVNEKIQSVGQTIQKLGQTIQKVGQIMQKVGKTIQIVGKTIRQIGKYKKANIKHMYIFAFISVCTLVGIMGS